MSEYLNKRREWAQFGKPPKPPKENKGIAKKSEKKLAEEAKEREARGDGDTELQKWFKARMKHMGDRCLWCGCKVENKIYQYAIMSICHILEKRNCLSVATHPLNWVTLCVDHHHMFDNMSWEEREKLGFFDIVQERLIMMWPDLAEEEKRFFPDSVKDFITKNSLYE